MAIALVVLAVAIVAAAAAFGASTRGRMSSADPDLPPVALPEDRWTIGADLDRTRFGVCLRGYRMAQVDEVLDRVSRDLVQREDDREETVRQRLQVYHNQTAQLVGYYGAQASGTTRYHRIGGVGAVEVIRAQVLDALSS